MAKLTPDEMQTLKQDMQKSRIGRDEPPKSRPPREGLPFGKSSQPEVIDQIMEAWANAPWILTDNDEPKEIPPNEQPPQPAQGSDESKKKEKK